MTSEEFEKRRVLCEEYVKSSVSNTYEDFSNLSELWSRVGYFYALLLKEKEEVEKRLKKEEAVLFVKYKESGDRVSDVLCKNLVAADSSLDSIRALETEANYRVNVIRGYYEALVAKRQYLSRALVED